MRQSRPIGISLLVSALITNPACHDIEEPLVPDPLNANVQATFDASVQFLNLEGGCWAITPSPNVYYQPLSLPPEFRHDGMKVRVEAKRRDDYGSVCMFGPVVELLSIRSR
jgi:hypothetical protein